MVQLRSKAIAPLRSAGAVVFASALMMASPAHAAPQSSRITFFSSVDYAGEAARFDAAIPDIDVRSPLLSAKVDGGSWQLCTKNRYRGQCVIVSDALSNLKKEFGFFTKVSSARPWPVDGAAPVVAAAVLSPSVATAQGRSEEIEALFYRLPTVGGRLLPACTAGEEAAHCGAAGAARFCQDEGRQDAQYFTTRVRGEETVVADLLCTGKPGS